MIFSQYNYKSYHLDNKNDWPEKDWCKMVNDDYTYTRVFGFRKWILFFYFLIIRERFIVCDINSNHPCWKKMSDIKYVKRIRQELKVKKAILRKTKVNFVFNVFEKLYDGK